MSAATETPMKEASGSVMTCCMRTSEIMKTLSIMIVTMTKKALMQLITPLILKMTGRTTRGISATIEPRQFTTHTQPRKSWRSVQFTTR